MILAIVLVSLCARLADAQDKPKPEFRAYWVDSLYNKGLKSKSEIDLLLSTVRASNMNAVVVQMRRRGDTYYKSTLEPMAPDADPSFDSLEYLCKQAHAPGKARIDVHVWLCTFPIWRTPSQRWAPPASPEHVLNKHPEWLDKFSNGRADVGPNYCIDPGNPDAMQFTVDVAMDVVKRYDIDGINFDYIRYPEDTYRQKTEWGYNDVAVARFNKLYGKTGTPSSDDPDFKQFRRDNVTAFLRKVYANVLAVKPLCKVSADTWTTFYGPWHVEPDTDEDWVKSTPYSIIYQDWRAWMEEGILDLNMPMTYYPGKSPAYDTWIAYEKSHKYDRHLSIGVKGNKPKADLIQQLEATRTPALWNGKSYCSEGQQIYFYHRPFEGGVEKAPEFAPELVAQLYPTPVPVPEMPWKTHPTKGHIKGTCTSGPKARIDGMTVSISGPQKRAIKTDGTGFYAFIDLEPGKYTVTCSYEGRTRTSQLDVAVGKVSDADFDFSK